jgi:restriction endonuclease Mrr
LAAQEPQAAAPAAVATQEDFERIFADPSIDKMLALTPRDFERFIAHVFECAGYRVEDVARNFFPEGPGVDLNLYASPGASKPVSRVEIKRWQQNLRLPHVMQFIGVLTVAGGIPGYMVSTGGFGGGAAAAAQMASHRVQLIDGEPTFRTFCSAFFAICRDQTNVGYFGLRRHEPSLASTEDDCYT